MNPKGQGEGHEEERLEELRFLFERAPQAAQAGHPPLVALTEYAQGLRPEGIDPQGWERQALSTHVALCPICQRKLRGIRRRQRLQAFVSKPTRLGQRVLGEERWRRAYQYLGLLLLVGGIFLVYSLWQGTTIEPPAGERPPPPAGEHTGDTPGVG